MPDATLRSIHEATLREILEGIRDGDTLRPSFMVEGAVAALKILDGAVGCNPIGRVMTMDAPTHRLIPDPQVVPPASNTNLQDAIDRLLDPESIKDEAEHMMRAAGLVVPPAATDEKEPA